MSNSFYHERYCLTKRQEEVIAPLLPAPKTTGRPSLTMAIGTVSITNSDSGALKM